MLACYVPRGETDLVSASCTDDVVEDLDGGLAQVGKRIERCDHNERPLVVPSASEESKSVDAIIRGSDRLQENLFENVTEKRRREQPSCCRRSRFETCWFKS